MFQEAHKALGKEMWFESDDKEQFHQERAALIDMCTKKATAACEAGFGEMARDSSAIGHKFGKFSTPRGGNSRQRLERTIQQQYLAEKLEHKLRQKLLAANEQVCVY